jgi:hypothetical protein
LPNFQLPRPYKITGEWNKELLADLISDLEDADFDTAFTGFDPPEIEQLMREKNTLYNEYREKREKTKELQTVKGNIEQILRREPERGKGRDNER